MKWTTAISRAATLEAAVLEVVEELKKTHLEAMDLAVVFVSAHHVSQYRLLPGMLHKSLTIRELVGCSGGGIIGGGREIESGPALSVTVAHLPEVGLKSFALDAEAVEALAERPNSWRELLELEPEHDINFILLPNPFICPAQRLLDGLDAAFPDSPKAGAMASGGEDRATTALFLRQGVEDAAVIGLVLWGDIQMDTAVAQGCRPIGAPFILTHCHKNLATQLDGEPAVKALDKVYGNLSEADRKRFRKSPHVGIGLHTGKHPFRQGDYLLRNVLGVDREKGAVALGARLKIGMELRFHIRDADTSAVDLDVVLDSAGHRVKDAKGALLFSCLGRGEGLYGIPGHDSGVFHKYFKDVALGGFFGNGEIGPVQGKTYLHGYTSAFAIFRPKSWS
jgi:small ligand-binding sensory domain FIST